MTNNVVPAERSEPIRETEDDKRLWRFTGEARCVAQSKKIIYQTTL